MTIHSRSVIASLSSSSPSSRSGTAFSSVSLSPGDATFAVASGKDVLHVLRLNLDRNAADSKRLEEIRSVRISQHFQSPIQTSNSGGGGQHSYPHLRDALRPPGTAPGSSAAPLPTPGGGGGVNINVMDVAWSLPQSYIVDNELESVVDNGKSWPRGVADIAASGTFRDSYEELTSHPDSEQHSSSHQEHHYPSFIRRRFISGGEHSTISSYFDDTSVIAAAGSNGVIVAWNASSLLSAPLLSNNSSGGLNSRKNVGSPQQVSSATFGQPEASFFAHSRAVNRLAWHPTGRRPYLLLTASQDGSVKLWDRRATSSSSMHPGSVSSVGSNASVAQSMLNLNAKSWFGFGSSSAVQSAQLPTSSVLSRTATWHCISTYQPKCEAVRDIRWNPAIDDIFAMVAGEWLCVYDIRINKPMVKESTHAGDATCIDWHPTRKYVIATGGGRDRSVKVWDLESTLNLSKQDDSSFFMKANAASYRSENSEFSSASHTSGEDPVGPPSNDTVGKNSQTVNSNLSSGSVSPVRRSTSNAGLFSRHHKKKIPVHVLNIAAPVTRIRWRPANNVDDVNDFIAVATSSIYGANSAAGGNGTVLLWSCVRSTFMPLSVCEGHTEGAVTDFAWAPVDGNLDSSSVRLRNGEEKQSSNVTSREWQTILTVGRDGQCLLQNFYYGERPILDVPRATFALANLSPFQPGFGSLQIMAVHQKVIVPDLNNEVNYSPPDLAKPNLVFSITDQGDVEDLNNASMQASVDVASELTHFSRFSELYATKIGGRFVSKADVCRSNASVAEGLNQKAITQMWKTLAAIIDGSGLDGFPSIASNSHSNPMAHLLTPTLRNLLLQRADAGDVQTCVVLCEVMDVIAPPSAVGGSAKSRIPNLNIALVREWYLTYIDLLQQMCLFTQAASLIRNCSDPVIGALNQQSTTIHESCPRCGKPLLGSTTIQDGAPRLSAQRICRSCRSRVGLCFLCHEPVKGVFVWCPGCGHGGHLDHALEWFGMNEHCPTGCGHKCNLFKNHNSNVCLPC